MDAPRGDAGSVIMTVAQAEDPLLVTVTVYDPAFKPVAVAPVPPVGDHE
jgi:hypothetical protein